MILPVYLYNGPEFGQRDEAVEAVIKALEKKFGESEQHIYYLNETSIGQVLSVLDNGNLFSSATCVICKNAELLKKKEDIALVEEWIKSVQDSGEESSALIFVSDEISVDSKLDKLIPASNKKQFWEMFVNESECLQCGICGKCIARSCNASHLYLRTNLQCLFQYIDNIYKYIEFGRFYLCQTVKDLSFIEKRYANEIE